MKWKVSLNFIAVLFFLTVVTLCVGYYCLLNVKPFTQNAFVVSDIQTVSPWVDGYVTEIYIKDGQKVRKGDPLLKTFSPPYALRVKELQSTIRKIDAKMEMIRRRLIVLASEIRRDEAAYRNQTYLAQQALQMYQVDAISQTYTEEKVRGSQIAEAQLNATRDTVPVLQAELKVLEEERNELTAQLELASIYLEQTTLLALNDGYVSNMFAAPGTFHKAGERLCAIVLDQNWRIQANFEETDLSLIHPGQRATIWLWQYPGQTFQGVVESIHYGVERQKTSARNALQVVEPENQWFMLPQRLPVQIRFVDLPPETKLNLGGSAYVQIDTSSQLLKQIIWRVYRW